MNIQIERVETVQQWTTVFKIRTQVFQKEWGFTFERLPGPGATGVHHFLACDGKGNGIATLSIVETTSDIGLHRRYGLAFPEDHSVARYAQLAVLRPYRGLHIPERLIQNAQRQVIHPNSFDFGWLLFPANRAATCELTRTLGFTPRPEVFSTEFGHCRVLVRDETAWRAALAGPAEDATGQFLQEEGEVCAADRI